MYIHTSTHIHHIGCIYDKFDIQYKRKNGENIKSFLISYILLVHTQILKISYTCII